MGDTQDRVSFYELIAMRKLGVGADWRWCNLNAIGPDAVKVEGGVPRLLKSGPRKGPSDLERRAVASLHCDRP